MSTLPLEFEFETKRQSLKRYSCCDGCITARSYTRRNKMAEASAREIPLDLIDAKVSRNYASRGNFVSRATLSELGKCESSIEQLSTGRVIFSCRFLDSLSHSRPERPRDVTMALDKRSPRWHKTKFLERRQLTEFDSREGGTGGGGREGA